MVCRVTVFVSRQGKCCYYRLLCAAIAWPNHGGGDYETAALPTELRRQEKRSGRRTSRPMMLCMIAGGLRPVNEARPVESSYLNCATGWSRDIAPCPGPGIQAGCCSFANCSLAILVTCPLA